MTRRSTTNGFQTATVAATQAGGGGTLPDQRRGPGPGRPPTTEEHDLLEHTAGTTSSSTATSASEGTARGSALPSPRVSARRSSWGTQTMS